MKAFGYQFKTRGWSRLAPLLAALLAAPVGAQQSSTDYAAIPPLITNNAPPNVMLVMSNDHELYKKAYTDYSDLDDDGLLDTSYNDDFTYAGYFDPDFCYTYDSTDGRFEPSDDISALIGTSGHSCDVIGVTGGWSGNFLNWAAMTRMDIVRNVLYGGKRQVDTATSGSTRGVTVLERAFLPEDIHSFVKVFAGDTARYTPYNQSSISLCSTTSGGSSNPPLLRVAYGSWPQWSSSEVVQCHYRDERDSGLSDQPQSTDRPSPYDFNVRVQVCEAAVDSGSNRCKPYIDSVSGVITYKPVGLLQQYGDNGNINFGLMTGSYNEKISGGVLRKDVLPLTGNSSGSNDEIDLDNGTFVNQGATDAGIINTLNRLRIVNWSYANNNYSDCDTHSIGISTFKTSTSSDRQCRNWGNPLSEIYLEAVRYFTGDEAVGATADTGVPTSSFNTDDSGQIASLPQLAWQDPLDTDNACSSCSIIVISTGLNSFDTDELSSVSDIWDAAGSTRLSTSTLDSLVNTVGDLEGITGGTFLIGENGTLNDKLCTAKVIASLSGARGLCPELPSLEGGFDMVGLAYHARTSDLRSFEGTQSVSTYSVALAESLPSFELDVNGKTVTFVPTCQASTDSSEKVDQTDWNDCSLSDVKVESATSTSGSLLIAWEDSRWGNDYDMDGVMRLEYCIGTDTSGCPGEPVSSALGSGYNWADFTWKSSGLTADSVQFRVSVPQAAAGNALRFGYIVSGVEDQSSNTTLVTNTPSAARANSPTTNASAQYVVYDKLKNGAQPFLLRQGGFTISRLTGSSGNRIIYVAPAHYTASSSVTAGAFLENPLWYSAKYGSFNDIDGDGTPLYNGLSSDTREWDVRDTLGNTGADGIPDNYFPVRNPSELITSLSQVFEQITERISSGTAAAVVANSSTGLGAVYQAYYYPTFTDANNNSMSWGGVLHAMFIDDSGRFREDNGTAGTLDDTSTDYVLDIFFDQTVVPNRTRFQRYSQSGSGPSATLTPVGAVEDLDDIGSIWNARDILAGMTEADLAAQRTLNSVSGQFDEPAQDKRYIFTYLDSISGGTHGEVDAGEVVDFTAANFDPLSGTSYRYLGLSNSSEATNVVNYIRGQTVSGYRSREVDIPGDGTDAVRSWRLGDIVHSSPLVVNPPNERYDIVYGDQTYAAFKQQYERRRQMIYVGGNDGMLHAFNGGVWETATRTFHTRAYDSATGTFTAGQSHALGAEMWGYVPMNLLPHLQWLKEQNYPHVYFMDAPPRAYDVNIFPEDAVHPGGWGTILVVGMRLGGGDFPLDLDNDSIDETTMRSAYVILDITDPESPPELLAEIALPGLGFTTSEPALIKQRAPSTAGSFATPSINRWVLVFGSGPDTLSSATSTSQDATLYAYDLVGRDLVTVHANAQTPATDPNGYFGDFLPVDWNNDFVDDAIYMGTVEGSEAAPSGRLKRIVLSNSTLMGLASGSAAMSDFLNVGQPVSAKPSSQIHVGKAERWVMFGTGRLFTRNDNKSTTQQNFYGLKEPADYDTSTLSASDLVDSTDIIVETDGDIHDGSIGTDVVIDTVTLNTFNDLFAFMDNKPGWKRDFFYDGSSPSERAFNPSLVIGTSVVFTSYLPSMDLCTIEGDGALYALGYRTGTAQVFSPLGDDNGVAFASVDLGQGAPSQPTAIVRTGDDPSPDGSSGGDLSVVTGSTTGVTESTSFSVAPGAGGRMSWEILEIQF